MFISLSSIGLRLVSDYSYNRSSAQCLETTTLNELFPAAHVKYACKAPDDAPSAKFECYTFYFVKS